MLYVISKPGKTGCSAAGVSDVAPRMDQVRRAAGSVPTTIGFGVSTPEHVRSFSPLADGVVVTPDCGGRRYQFYSFNHLAHNESRVRLYGALPPTGVASIRTASRRRARMMSIAQT